MNLKQLLFEQVTDENLISIQDTILDKFELWLPFVEVRDIQLLSNGDDTSIGVNEIRVKIDFNIKQDPNTLDSVSINFNSDISDTDSTTLSGGY